MIITATIPQYANGTFFIQAPGSNVNEVAGQISNLGLFNASVLPNFWYGITILPAEGTSYSRFGAMFTSSPASAETQDITAILNAATPPPVGGGTVTHTAGALTAGSMLIGNGGSDLKTSPCNFGITNAGAFAAPVLLANGGTAVGTDGLVIQAISSNPDQTGLIMENLSSRVNGFAWAVVGSNSVVRCLVVEDLIASAIMLAQYGTDANHSFNVMQQLGTMGWASSADPSTNAIDTGISRTAANVIAFGNGVNGNASARLAFASLLGPATAPTGAGVAGTWAFSQDGNISFCKAGTWEVVTTAP